MNIKVFQCIKCSYFTSYEAGMILHARLCGQGEPIEEVTE